MSLKKYNKKRDFSITKEPYGKKKVGGKKLLYLIQKHAASHLHYDLRLELKGTLKSWAVPKGPCLDPSVKRLAVHVEDHPIDYGSFEGAIPEGQYGGGIVMLWDTGEWQCTDPDPYKAYQKGNLKFVLKGQKLKGLWKLIQIKSTPKNWLLIKIDDKYAKPLDEYDITIKKSKSVKTKRSLDKIATDMKVSMPKSALKAKKKVKLPANIYPELATLVAIPPTDDGWLHEIKLDGYRLIAYVQNNKVRLVTRNQNDWTKKFPGLVSEIKKLKLSTAILDGEIIALNKDNRPDFQSLQNAIADKVDSTIIYYLFDLIYLDGDDLTTTPLLKRKEMLAKLIPKNNKLIKLNDYFVGNGKKIFKEACRLKLEGIISKKANSLYQQKRTHDWLKVKCIKRQEFIVIGFTKPSGSRQFFGSLLLAVYDKNKKLKYCGNVGTGFNDRSLKDIFTRLKKMIITKPLITTKPPRLNAISWVQPKLVVEVEFTEWTKDGSLRHPSFKGLRFDKKPALIIKENPTK